MADIIKFSDRKVPDDEILEPQDSEEILAERAEAERLIALKAKTDPGDFDGQIVSVIDTDMTKGGATSVVNRKTYFFEPGKGTYLPANYYWLNMLVPLAVNHFSQFYRPDFYDDSEVVDKRQQRFEEARKIAEQFLGKETVEIILEGRLKMSLLLNSSGGDADFCYILESILSYIQSNKGHIDTYVDRKAYSAAAKLFFRAGRRFVHQKSKIAIHTAYDDVTGRDTADWDYGDIFYLYNKLPYIMGGHTRIPSLDGAHPLGSELQQQIREQIQSNFERLQMQSPWERDGRVSDVSFAPATLQRFELAEVVENIDALMQRFMRETGITMDKMREEMRKVYIASRPSAKIDERELEPAAEFYVKALERQESE